MSLPRETPLSRRQTLSLIGVTAASAAASAGAAGLILPAEIAHAQASAGSGSGLIVPSANVCVLTPEVTEGPYYTDPKLIRADVTEGPLLRPDEGGGLHLRLSVSDPLGGRQEEKWTIEYLELEVAGRTAPEKGGGR